MQIGVIVGLVLALSPSVLAPALAADSAIAKLDAVAKSHVVWNFKKARRADVTCNGLTDTIVFGTGQNSVWVGVVPGGGGRVQVLRFAAAGNFQDAFAGPPIRINIFPLSCFAEDERNQLDGCKPVRKCKEFSIDNDADPFNFYWDSRNQIIRWWRY
jgi:hypothetical protein